MRISSIVDEFMTTTRLSSIQLPEVISIVPGNMGEETPMTPVINQSFHGIDMHGRSPEGVISARKGDIERNQMSYWTEEGGALDENADMRYRIVEEEFQSRLTELYSPSHCLRDALSFCELIIGRIDVDIAAVQEELGNAESAKIGISEHITATEAQIADFRQKSWLQQHRRRNELQALLRQYRDLCRNSLVMETFYQVRLRCVDVLVRIKGLMQSERLNIESLIGEVSSVVTDLAEAEREMQDFDYDSLVPNGKVLLEHGDLDFYFSKYRPLSDSEPIDDQALAQDLQTQLHRNTGSIRDHIDGVNSDILPVLHQLSDQRFSRIESLDIQDVLEMKYVDNRSGTDISRLLSEINARINESSRFLKISSLEKTGKDRKLAIRCISVNGGENSRMTKEWLRRIVTEEAGWNIVEELSDTEITFYQTEHAFALYMCTTVKELLKSYKGSSRKKRENIYHIYPEFAALPEIIPFNHRQAMAAFHKAAATGVLNHDNGSGWVYPQNGNSVYLGSNKNEILDFLSADQKIISALNDEFREQLLREGSSSIMPRMLSFAEAHKDGNGVIDPDLLQGIILRLDEEFAN